MSQQHDLQQYACNPDKLNQLSLPELMALWRRSCPRQPPPAAKSLLVIDLACVAQSGGHRHHRETDALIRSAIKAVPLLPDDHNGKKRKMKPSASRLTEGLTPGAKLVREWGGRAHEVTVLANGKWFQYQGQTYKTLTKVAKAITGTHWSGPRFFGLHKCREEKT